ncbi:MAG: hypothetical protein B7Y99_02970 [Caulobacterales bacterium 32-69-10]|nr:MAG: hypothetical protein B7Y99_02970 [Caulobacterales bacterium 32-69-10]
MRTTLVLDGDLSWTEISPGRRSLLDGDLFAKAQSLTGLSRKSALVREALVALIERESALRLAQLGGSKPGLVVVQRRSPHSV